MRVRQFILSAGFGLTCAAAIGAAGQGGGRAGGPPGVPVVPAQAGAAQAPAVMKPGVAHIAGKVVEAGTTTGVSGAVVTLSGEALGPPTSVFANGIPGGSRRAIADSQGQFLFRDLPAGIYNIATRAAGYVDGAYGETRIIQIRRTLDLVRVLEVTETDRLLPVTIQMWKNGGISGRVIDEAGEPVVGGSVTILARMTDWGGPVMQQISFATTDDRGMYHADVVPGDYIVGLLAATTTMPVSAVEGFQQAMNEGGAALDLFLRQVQITGGMLARGVGVRAGNLLVNQRDARNLSSVPPFVGDDGRLFFYQTTYHPSSLTATSAAILTLLSGEEKTGIDLQLRATPARRISGRVLGPNGPAGGISLMLVAPDPAVGRTSPATLIDTPMAMADGNGEFTFLGIAAGTYTLRAMRATAAAEPLLWAADSVSLGDTDVTDLQVRLQIGARVSGRIVVEGAGTPPPANALRAIGVAPRPLPGSVGSLMNAPSNSARPDEVRFTSAQVVPGPYMMTVTGVPRGWILKSVTLAGQNVVDKAFDVPASGVSDVLVTITDQISTLTGIARDNSGQPAPASTVAVFPADKSLWRLPGMASRRVQVAAPGRDGRYTFGGLPSGDYIVAAADWPGADFSDGRVLTALMATGSRVTLTDGGSLTQDLRVTVMR